MHQKPPRCAWSATRGSPQLHCRKILCSKKKSGSNNKNKSQISAAAASCPAAVSQLRGGQKGEGEVSHAVKDSHGKQPPSSSPQPPPAPVHALPAPACPLEAWAVTAEGLQGRQQPPVRTCFAFSRGRGFESELRGVSIPPAHNSTSAGQQCSLSMVTSSTADCLLRPAAGSSML